MASRTSWEHIGFILYFFSFVQLEMMTTFQLSFQNGRRPVKQHSLFGPRRRRGNQIKTRRSSCLSRTAFSSPLGLCLALAGQGDQTRFFYPGFLPAAAAFDAQLMAILRPGAIALGCGGKRRRRQEQASRQGVDVSSPRPTQLAAADAWNMYTTDGHHSHAL